MSAIANHSVFGRPLRPDLAAYFAIPCCAASLSTRVPERPLTGVLAELARAGRLG